ncbi:MAG: MATE family efflux transporter [Betaproteobacteria bacterium]|nr:MATE family efflux transporter [Betaproteobacteria bacterium]
MFQRNGKLLHKRFAGYFFPTILMTMALSLSLVIDGIIVGNMLGPDELAAVNLGLPLIQAFCVLFILLGVGGSVLAAYHKGRRENTAANHVFTVTVLVLALCSLACVVGGAIFLENLATLLSGNNPALRTLVLHFIEPIVYGAPLLVLLPGVLYFVRTDGHPRLASTVFVVANIVSLVCDIVFIRLMNDVRGAALATIVGYGVGACLLVFYVRSRQRGFRFALPREGSFGLALRVAKAGAASGLNGALIFLKLLCLNVLVLSIAGKSGMVAFSVCISCMALASMFMTGASQSMMPFVGVLYGEGDFAGIRFIFRRTMGILFASTAVLVILLEIFAVQFFGFFGINGGEDLELGTVAVRLFAPSLLGMAFSFLVMYYAQTIQREGVALAITITEGFAVLVPGAWLLAQFIGIHGVWLAFSLAEIVTLGVIFLIVRRVERQSEGKLRGLLMLPIKEASARALDVSIRNNLEEAVRLSEEASRFCREAGLSESTAMQVGLALEEMAVNTIHHGGNADESTTIDIALSISEEDIRISFRDDGKPFNPVEYFPPETGGPIVTGIPLIRKMAERIEYGYTLGFNSSLVVIKIY